MKQFLKYTMATVVGLVLVGIIFTVLGIATLFSMAAFQEKIRL